MGLNRRLELQSILEGILGSKNVYFQPPSNITMKYPAILYERTQESTDHADNGRYRSQKRYKVTCIDRDPDSETPDKIANLQYSLFDRFFIQDNLNHTVYNIHY